MSGKRSGNGEWWNDMNKIEPRNLDTVESPIINNFQVMIFKDRLDYWYLVLTDSVQSIEYDMECDNFDQAIELFNLEVNYIRDHGKLRDVWTEDWEQWP